MNSLQDAYRKRMSPEEDGRLAGEMDKKRLEDAKKKSDAFYLARKENPFMRYLAGKAPGAN